jgi:hypothetical protein
LIAMLKYCKYLIFSYFVEKIRNLSLNLQDYIFRLAFLGKC